MNDRKITTLMGTDEKFLIIEDARNTLAAMVMLKEIEIYWLDCSFEGDVCYHASLVDNPQTIYGATPNEFGIKL